jgi:AbrB family looped-hinge helix DNA binding protein
METRLSTKGQIVLPGKIRQRLGLKPGDRLVASIEDGKVVLTPHRFGHSQASIVQHPISGLPILSVHGDVPLLTSDEVAEMLADFP